MISLVSIDKSKAYRTPHVKILVLGLFSMTVGTCDDPVVAPKTIVPPTINTTSLAEGIVGESYSHQLSAGGGDGSYSWSIASGTLPSGVSLSSGGLISGTPTATGTATFSVQASSSGLTDERSLELNVVYGSPDILTTGLSPAIIGESYADTLRATGGDGSYVWSKISGELPDGIKLRNETGVLSGRARSVVEADLRFQVTSAEKNGQADLTFSASYPAPRILTTDLTDAEVGVEHSESLVAQGGDGESYTWDLVSGALPDGLSLSEMGEISGTPVRSDTSTVVVRVTSGQRATEASMEMAVMAGALSIITDSLPDAETGTAYNQPLEAVGGDGTTYRWSQVGDLPDGLGLSNDGFISGSPTTSGTSNFTLRVVSGSEQGDRSLSITVLDTLGISTSSLGDGTAGQPYSQVLSAVGGTGNYAWSLSVGALPSGLTLSSDGAISGTPSSGGTSGFSVTVTSGDISASRTFSITVLSLIHI